ncbi:MAG TPA: adenylate/guanylate cyclase domain-containing protein [Stellaceae bacterium]|nr:adenylate/guanylate cyclase domain-containing protein [Stellaceae bacterium]
MVTGVQVVDINVDPVDQRRRRRRALSRLGIPIGGVTLMVVAILAIALYSDRVNRVGALALSDELLAALQQRIALEVTDYLDAAAGVLRLERDAVRDGALAEKLPLIETMSSSLLREVPQTTNLLFADAAGNFVLVRRGEAGGTEMKLIVNPPGARRVTWIRYDDKGAELGRADDPADDYDARTRDWYIGARGSDALYWTGAYIFFTGHVPGLTVSARYGGADGQPSLFGVDITLDALSRFLGTLEIGRHGQAIIIDDTGHVIAAPHGSAVQQAANGDLATARVDQLGDDVLTHAYDRYRIDGSGHRAIDVDGRRYISAVTPISGAGRNWSVMIVVPEDDFVGFIARNDGRTLALSLVIVGVATLLALLLVQQGFRADRSARLALDRQTVMSRQSAAFATLAADAGLIDPARNDPPRSLTETLANVTGARRASILRFTAGERILRCEDCCDRDMGGHIDGLELHRDELPQLFAHLLAGDEIDVADAAHDVRTAELHRVMMRTFGTTALLAMPIRRHGRVVGAVALEDAPARAGNRDFVRAVANMVALRLGDTAAALPARERGAAPDPAAPHETVARSFVSDLRPVEIDPTRLGAEIFRDVAVMVLRFTDATAMALRVAGGERCLSDEIARILQQVAAEHGIPYLKLVGHEVVAAAGFGKADAAAASLIADAALAVRDRCAALFEDSKHVADFQIGIDCGAAIGSIVGSEPRMFNLWGDAVTVAQTMAASALPGTVQATEAAYRRLRHDFLFRQRGSFYLPQVGEARTFVLAGRL